MRHRIGLLSAIALLCMLSGRAAEPNLVANGDFDTGSRGQAEAWSRLDGLTAEWRSQGGRPGGCLHMDTTVLQKDKQAHLANPEAPVKRSRGGQYETVGAHEGVWAFAQPVELRKDDRCFLLEADVKGPASTRIFHPQILMRGYRPFDPRRDEGTSSYFQTPHEGGPAYSEQFGKEQREARKGDFLMVWRKSLVCRLRKDNAWQHFRVGIKLPGTARFRPDVLLIKPYAMWPLGEYAFDNITLRRCSEEEYREARKKGHTAR